jgi:membrane protease YdiL (CAAX protease family)
LLYLFLRRRKSNFKAIGLKGRVNFKDVGFAVLGLIVYFAIYAFAINILSSSIHSFNVNQQQQIGFNQAHGPQLILVFISLVILPPIVEEILVRGFLYTSLKKYMPKIWAVLIASTLFAAAHLPEGGSGAPLLWVAGVDTFILSTVLIYLRDRTDKLWSSMMVHAMKNGVAFLSLFVFHVVK